MNQLLFFFENTFIVTSLLLFSQGFFIFFIGHDIESNPDPNSALLQLFFTLIYLITFLFLALRWQVTLRYLNKHLWLVFLLALAIMSILWSSIPVISFKKVISLIGTTLFGIYLGTHHSYEKQLKILCWTFGIAIVFSLAFILLLPNYGLTTTASSVQVWRGIYPHKNGLGQNMFISFLAFYTLSLSKSQYRFGHILKLGSFTSVILIFFAKSATSLLSVFFTYTMIQALQRLSLKSKKGVLTILLFLIIIFVIQIFLIVNLNDFLAVNNRDITLSGRTPLWQGLWEFIQLKLWFGYGYGAFFSAEHTETNLLWREFSWGVMHAHNGFIQLFLHLGIVGCAIFSLSYFRYLLKSLFMYLVFKTNKMLWIFSFLNYTIFFNFTEVSFFSGNSIIWIVSLATIFSLDMNNHDPKNKLAP